MVFTLKIDKIIDAIFATDTSFFTLKIDKQSIQSHKRLCRGLCVCMWCVVCVYIFCPLSRKVILNQTGK